MKLKQKLSNKKWALKYEYARYRYNNAVPFRYYLDENDFKKIANKYKHIEAKNAVDYSNDGQKLIAEQRCNFLQQITKRNKFESVCEIGIGSGNVLKGFLELGVPNVYGVDIENRTKELDSRINFSLKGVHNMSHLADNSIDLLYSFDAFEHIPNIETAFDECFRILKPGSIMYIKPCSPYLSPWAAHFYHILRIPYAEVLFSDETLTEYAKSVNKEIPFINRVPATRYFDYLKKLPSNAKLMSLNYDFDWYGTDLIIKYPEVFKAKQESFFDFFVSNIYIIIKKIG